jgi:hypothetical protein
MLDRAASLAHPTRRIAGGGDPGSTPAIVAKVVIAVSSACVVHSIDAPSGKPVWQRNMAEEYKSRFASRGGCATSPLIVGDRVIVPTGAAAGARLVALDSASGKTLWAADSLLNSLNGSAGYAQLGDARTVLYHHAKPPGTSGLSGVNADTGAVAWQVDPEESPTPFPYCCPTTACCFKRGRAVRCSTFRRSRDRCGRARTSARLVRPRYITTGSSTRGAATRASSSSASTPPAARSGGRSASTGDSLSELAIRWSSFQKDRDCCASLPRTLPRIGSAHGFKYSSQARELHRPRHSLADASSCASKVVAVAIR